MEENNKYEKLKWGGKEEKDLCTSCGTTTQHNKFDHIDMRKYYVEGAGQLCYDCYMRVYFKDSEGTLPPA
jgi:hypothetical protein|tara:strand:- start:1008 stop:1217 length:210 start_codon:yes stop_codon:yes gene_type:complete